MRGLLSNAFKNAFKPPVEAFCPKSETGAISGLAIIVWR